jgi:hypothetical protein
VVSSTGAVGCLTYFLAVTVFLTALLPAFPDVTLKVTLTLPVFCGLPG